MANLVSGARLRLSNRDARALWVWTNGLNGTPNGPLDVVDLIKRLGFVQIDTIRNVTRAHHHILWSRNQNYREKDLWHQLGDHRALFEHFTHDASLIPMEFLPNWQRQFRRMGEQVAKSKWYQTDLGHKHISDIHARIKKEGALSTHAFDTKIVGERVMWSRPPHKKALDQMWYGGVLATSRRENFVKYYDLAERVFRPVAKAERLSDAEQIDWLCKEALHRLSFANTGQIQRFWGATENKEVKTWVEKNQLKTIEIETANGDISEVFASVDVEDRLAMVASASPRLRILNPFDPAIRDRARLKQLFGFNYRNEMFVPKTQRIWGYYVYPILEGNRFVGRIEISADRQKNQMQVIGFWPEQGVKWTQKRRKRLDSELKRFGRLANIKNIGWAVSETL